MFGSIIGAVAGPVISALAGGRKDRSTTTTTKTDLVALVKDAQAAGFNPLTALEATGGGTTATTVQPALSSFEFMGQALGAGLSAWDATRQQNIENMREQARLDLFRQDMENSRRGGVPFGATIPTYDATGVHASGGLRQTVPPIATPYGGMGPVDKSPNAQMGSDGMMEAAPDAGSFEDDFYQSVRQGAGRNYLQTLFDRNFYNGTTPEQRRQWLRGKLGMIKPKLVHRSGPDMFR
ncbi:DNA pilot protein [Tortoise microvirus 46]|nr:DNA pilot protein [Tortoise microvirus 46]